MPTRRQILDLVADGLGYAEVGKALGLPPGQAYMIATGLPADGGDTFTDEDPHPPGAASGSTQHLVYLLAQAENPATKAHVLQWIKDRAASDPSMRASANSRDELGERRADRRGRARSEPSTDDQTRE